MYNMYNFVEPNFKICRINGEIDCALPRKFKSKCKYRMKNAFAASERNTHCALAQRAQGKSRRAEDETSQRKRKIEPSPRLYQKGFRFRTKRPQARRMKLERSAVSGGCGKPRIVFRPCVPAEGFPFTMCVKCLEFQYSSSKVPIRKHSIRVNRSTEIICERNIFRLCKVYCRV